MSAKSNNQGLAFEYIFINTIYKDLTALGINSKIINDEHYRSAEKGFLSTSSIICKNLKKSAEVATQKIFELEPTILEPTTTATDIVILYIQSNIKGATGDVRDVILQKQDIKWEIGLSLKHNHFAVKHSRLSKNIDFGEKWYGHKCSAHYWKKVLPIFGKLDKIHGKPWCNIPNKINNIYVPILEAFIGEIKRTANNDSDMPKKMVQYLLGKYDFYKIISVDNQNMARIDAFNIYGSLNKKTKTKKSKFHVPIIKLPTRLMHIGFKPKSKTTVEIVFDNGWSFNFRIHNASTLVENSLKFDIQFVGLPASIMRIDCKWI